MQISPEREGESDGQEMIYFLENLSATVGGGGGGVHGPRYFFFFRGQSIFKVEVNKHYSPQGIGGNL